MIKYLCFDSLTFALSPQNPPTIIYSCNIGFSVVTQSRWVIRTYPQSYRSLPMFYSHQWFRHEIYVNGFLRSWSVSFCEVHLYSLILYGTSKISWKHKSPGELEKKRISRPRGWAGRRAFRWTLMVLMVLTGWTLKRLLSKLQIVS